MNQQKFINEYGDIAILKEHTDKTWYCDLGCGLWDREYKNKKSAINYLNKNGYVEIKE